MKKEKTDKKVAEDEAEKRVVDGAEAGVDSDVCACEDEVVLIEEEQKPSEEQVLRDKLLRLHADFDNYRKRVARDHSDMVKQSNADLVESLLPVLDHIGHAEAMMEKTASADAAPYLEGFRMVKNELLKTLSGYGLKPIETVGLPFDANVHEALSTMPSDVAKPDDVLFEIRGGYLLNGRVLRAAQVIVATDGIDEVSVSETPAFESVSEETGE